jgi:hypothetical protein
MTRSVTSENLALAIVKYVAAKALPVLEANLFMAKLVNRDYESTLAQAGDTVNIPVPPTMSANNIAETGDVTVQSLSLGNIPVTLTSHIEATFTVPDVSKALSVVGLAETFMAPAMMALGERVESDLLGTYPLFTYNAQQGASNTPPTEAVLDAVETQFFKSRVPVTQPKFVACSADFYSSLRQIPRFSESQTIGSGNSIITGEFLTVKSLNFMRSQLVLPVSTTTTNLAFTRDAIALVVRKLDLPMAGQGAVGAYAEYGGLGMRVIMSYNPNSLAQQFTVDLLYGVSALRNQFGMQVLS